MYDSYIICTSPRSGSTLLCHLLRDTGIAGHPQSYFHRPSLSEWRIGLDLPPSADLPDIIHAAKRTGEADAGLFGLRLQRHSFDFLMEQLRALHPEADSDMACLTKTFGRTRLVHLTRADKVDQAVSLVRADQSGLWHKHADGSELERNGQGQEPRYDHAAIVHHVAELTAFENDWNTWFDAIGQRPHRITYDQLATDPAGTVGTLLAALGLDSTAAASLRPATAKLADATNAAWAAQFRARTLAQDGETQ